MARDNYNEVKGKNIYSKNKKNNKKKKETATQKKVQSPSVSSQQRTVDPKETRRQESAKAVRSTATRFASESRRTAGQNQKSYGNTEGRSQTIDLPKRTAQQKAEDRARGQRVKSGIQTAEDERKIRERNEHRVEVAKNTGRASVKGAKDTLTGYGKTLADVDEMAKSNEKWTEAKAMKLGVDRNDKKKMAEIEKERQESIKQSREFRMGLAEKQEKRQKEFDEQTKDASDLEKALYGAAESGTGMLIDTGIGAVTGTGQFGALASMGLRTYGTTRGQAEKEGATEKEDRLYSLAQAGKEMGTELMFQGAGLAKGYTVSKSGKALGLSLADKASFALTKGLTGKTADVASAGIKVLGGTAEENIEELAGWMADPVLKEAIYGRNVRQRTAESLRANLPEVTSKEDADRVAAYFSTDKFETDLTQDYINSGLSKKEASELAQEMRDYYVAYYSNDEETLNALEDDLSQKLSGQQKLSKSSWSMDELLDTFASTTLLTLGTGLPGGITSSVKGNQMFDSEDSFLRQRFGDNAVKLVTDAVKNTSDAEMSAKAQAMEQRLSEGKDLTGTQKYELAQGYMEKVRETSKKAEASKDVVVKESRKNDYVATQGINANGERVYNKETQKAYDAEYQKASNTVDELKKSLPEDSDFRADAVKKAVADLRVGGLTVGDAHEFGYGNTLAREALKKELGVDLDKYVVRTKNGDIDYAATNDATENALFELNAKNAIEMAQIETDVYIDDMKGEIDTDLLSRFGGNAQTVWKDVNQDLDPHRDLKGYLATADAVSFFVSAGRNTDLSVDEIMKRYANVGMNKSVDDSILRQAIEAGRQDRIDANTPGNGQTVEAGQKIALKKTEPITTGELIIEEGLVIPDSDQQVYKALADATNANIHLVSTLSPLDENGKPIIDKKTGKPIQLNGMSHGNDIYLNLNASAEENLGYVFMHEMTHQIKQYAPNEYLALENLVRDRWFNKDQKYMDRMIKDRIALYSAKADQTLTEEEALEEIIADAMAEAMDDPNFASEVCEQNPDVAEQIINAIRSALRSIRQMFAGGKTQNTRFHNGLLSYLGILDDAERMWLDALAVAKQNKANGLIADWQARANRYSLGYHAGDLGKSTVDDYAHQGYSRGTGHFGFGTYFVGDEKEISYGNYGKRKHESVDFDKYNLFEPRNAEQGYALHKALKTIDGFIDEYSDFRPYFNDYMLFDRSLWNEWYDKTSKINRDIEDLVYDYDYASRHNDMSDIDMDRKAKVDKYIDEMPEHYREDFNVTAQYRYDKAHRDEETIRKDLEEDYDQHIDWLKDYFPTRDKYVEANLQNEIDKANEQKEIPLEKWKYDLAKDKIKNYTESLEFKRKELEKLVNALYYDVYGLARTKTDIENALLETERIVKGYGERSFDKPGLDSAATVFMKQLGYEGVDVRHIKEMDNTGYGSVIYDLKGEDLARKQEIGTARFSIPSTDSEGAELSEGQREFFKDSKVVDQNGNLLVLYHGTPGFGFTKFDNSGYRDHDGYFFTNRRDAAESYVYGDEGGVYSVYLNLTNPMIIDAEDQDWTNIQTYTSLEARDRAREIDARLNEIRGAWRDGTDNGEYQRLLDEYDELDSQLSGGDTDSWVATAKENGHDGLIILNIIDYGENYNGGILESFTEVIAFEQNQIKNTDNLNPTEDVDIRYSVSEDTIDSLNEDGVDITESGSAVKYSLYSWQDTDIEELKNKLRSAGFDDKRIDKWIKDVNSIAALISADMTRLNYTADQFQDALKPNSEYYFTLDLSTLCQKRRLYQGTYNKIMRYLVNSVLMPEDTVRLRAMMDEMGYEVPCGICYEESRKKNEGKFAERWLNGYGKKWKGYKNQEHEDPYIPTLYEVTTTEGREKLREEHPEAYESYVNYQKTRGSANPKISYTHTDYRGDILGMTESDIAKVLHIGGLRIQSFSDFEIPHVIDMMQAVMDMAAQNLTAQAYTKVPAFAKIFGGTGIKINLSLIQKVDENGNPVYDEKGRLVFDSKEGIDPEEAFALRDKYSQNVGTILVGTSNQQILDAWADPRVDMVIPFHRSGWSKKEFEKLGLIGYKDFTKGQTERYMMGKKDMALSTASKALGLTKDEKLQPIYSADYWDNNLSGKENAERYLALCAEKHYRPVFYQFLHDNGDGTWSLQEDGSTDGYWKSLIDFKMYDNDGNFAPQEEVQPVFDMEEANKIMGEYEGGADTLPVADDVVEEFLKEYKENHPNAKFDITDNAKLSIAVDLDDDYMDAVNSGDMDKAQSLVDEAAKMAGYDVRAYHGTSNYGFTEFKYMPQENGRVLGDGFYFTDIRDVAEKRYANKGAKWDDETQAWVPKTPGVYDVYLKPEGDALEFDWADVSRNKSNDFEAIRNNPSRDVVIHNIKDGININSTVYVIKDANRIKSADTVTYAEDGSVIPLSQRFDPTNNDIRYSMPTQDSEGRVLSDGQMEYFANSQARDEQGRLVPVYHTTNKGGFTIFDPSYSDDKRSLFFASNYRVSQTYGGHGANYRFVSELSEPKKGELIEADFDSFEDFEKELRVYLSSKHLYAYEDQSSRLKFQVRRKNDNEIAYELGRRAEDRMRAWLKMRDDPETASAYKVNLDAWWSPNGDSSKIEADSYEDLMSILRERMTYQEQIPAPKEKLLGADNEGLSEEEQILRQYGINRGYYKTYLNLENPMIVDAEGHSWNAIPYGSKGNDYEAYREKLKSEYSKGVIEISVTQEFDDEWSIQNSITIEALVQIKDANGEWYPESYSQTVTIDLDDYADEDGYPDASEASQDIWEKAEDYLMDEVGLPISYLNYLEIDQTDYDGDIIYSAEDVDFIDAKQDRYEVLDPANFDEDAPTYRTRELAKMAKQQGHDGVIIKNCYDIGGVSHLKGSNGLSDIYIAFSSEQVKDFENTNPTENPDIRYSLTPEDDALEWLASQYELDDVPLDDEQAEEGRVRMAKSKKEFVHSKNVLWNERWLTEGKILDVKSVRKSIKNVVMGAMANSNTKSQYKNALVDKTLVDAKSAYWMMKDGKHTEAAELLWDSAVKMIEDVDFFDDTLFNHYKDLRDYLKKTSIKLGEEYWSDVDYNAFRKRNYGRIKLVKGDTNVDQVLDELNELAPEWFSDAAFEKNGLKVESVPDILLQMESVLDAIQPYRIAYSSEEMEELAGDIANDLYDIVYQGEEYKSIADTFKQRYDAKTKALKARHEEAMRKAKEQNEKKVNKEKERFKEYKEKEKNAKSKAKHFGSIASNIDWLTDRLLNETKDKNIPEGFRKSLAHLLMQFDMQTERSKKLEAKYGPAKKTLKMRELKDRLDKIAKEDDTGEFRYDGYLFYLMDALAEKVDGKTIDALDTEDLIVIDTMLKSIRHNFSNYNKIRIQEEQVAIANIGDTIISQMKDRIAKYGQRKSYKGVRGLFDKLVNEGEETPIYYFERLDPTGDGIGAMYKELRRGEDRHIRNMDFLRNRFKQMFSEYSNNGKPGSELESWRDDSEAKTFNLKNGSITLTPSQIMSLYCLSKRPQALGHILGAGIVASPVTVGQKLADQFKGETQQVESVMVEYSEVQEIIASLTEDQVKLADEMQSLLNNEMAAWGNETSLEMYGIKLFREQDYFPIKSSSESLTKTADSFDVQEKIKNFGFTKPLVRNANNAIMIDDIFSVVADHCNKMSLYNAMAIPISDFMRVYNYKQHNEDGSTKTVQQAIGEAFTRKANDYIMKFIGDVNGNTKTRSDAVNDLMNKALANYKKASIGLNMRVALQQPTAIFRALMAIDAKYFVGTKPSRQATKEMFEHCPISLWKSWGHYDMDMGRDVEDIMMNKDWSRADAVFMGIYGELDNITWGMIWQAAKNEVKAKHPEVEEGSPEFWELCNERASEVFDKTQVVDSIFHRSDTMRSKNTLTKMATSFMAEPTLTYNVFRDSIARANEMWKDGDREGASKLIRKMVFVLALNAAAVSASAALWDAVRGKGADDDDDKGFGALWLMNFLQNFADNANMINNIYFVKDIYGLKDGWGTSNMALEGFETFFKGWSQLHKKLTEGSNKSWYDIFMNLLGGAGYITGVPVKTFMRDAKAILSKLGMDVFADDGSDNTDDDKANGIVDSIMEKMGYRKKSDAGTTSEKGSSESDSKSSGEESAEDIKSLSEDTLNKLDAKAEEKVKGYAGSDRDEVLWDVLSDGYTKHIQAGDMDYIYKLRVIYQKHGGNIDVFNSKVASAMPSIYKKTFKENMTEEDIRNQEEMRDFMLRYGMSEAELSDICYHTDTAKDLKAALRMGNEQYILDELVPLIRAGLTREDFERLYKNRNRGANTYSGKYNDPKYTKTTGQFIWPADGVITSRFGHRDSPTAGASSYHQAIDIGASQGTPVVASDGGVVISAGANGGYGNSVGIKHSNGMVTYYNHLYSWNVKVGDQVGQGQQIGQVGSTGISTGPHLDFKILDAEGNAVDPEKYLNKRS